MSYVNIQHRTQPFAIRYMLDLLSYRHLCANLVASDMRARFRRTKLGVLWAIVQPLAFSSMLALVWGQVLGMPDFWSFAIYVFSGIIIWEAFANTVAASQDSLKAAKGYLEQSRIPLLVFQLRTPMTALVVMFYGVIALFILLAALQRLPEPGLHLLLVPAFFGVFALFLMPLAITMSVVGTLFRDVRHISALAVQGLFFVSPVMLQREVYNDSRLEFLMYANPMASFIELFRTPILDGAFWSQKIAIVASIWIVGMWVIAIISSGRAGRRIIFAL